MRDALLEMFDTADGAKAKTASRDLWCRIRIPSPPKSLVLTNGTYKPKTDIYLERLVSYAHNVYTFARNRPAHSWTPTPHLGVFSLHESEFYVDWLGQGPNMNGADCSPFDAKSEWIYQSCECERCGPSRYRHWCEDCGEEIEE